MREGISIEVSATRPRAIGNGCGGPQQPAEICLVGADHSGDGGRLRHGGDHAPGWRLETLRMALAAPLHGSRGRWPVARQDAQARQGADPRAGRRAIDRAHARRPAGRDDPLDEPGDGGGDGVGDQHGAKDLARPWSRSPSAAGLQAQPRPALCRQTARCRRPLRQPAGAQPGALGRREEPDPGARPHPAGLADETGPRRDDDA